MNEEKIKELETMVETLKTELEKLKALKAETEKSKDEKTKGLAHGDHYWMIEGDAFPCEVVYRNDGIDERAMSIGNCFKTREEAEFEIERLKVFTELKKFAMDASEITGDEMELWYIVYGLGNRSVYSSFSLRRITADLVFASQTDAENAIEAVGEDRIKKYYFGITE